MQLRGRTALVSGAGRNNGRAIALRFAGEGADLVLVSRTRQEQLDEVAKECAALGATVVARLADMTDPEQVDAVVAAGLERFGKIDVAVNVVGLRPHGPFLETSYAQWREVFTVNCDTLFLLAQAVAPGMAEHGSGSIIALGGMASMWTLPQGAAVVASKHALYGLVKSLARELGPAGVRVNLLNPGHIRNVRLNPEWYGGHEPGSAAEADQTPLRRIGTNAEVADVALFLASDQSSFVTGDRILVAGGRYM